MHARVSFTGLRAALVVGSILAILLLSGCKDQCASGQTRCDGNQIENCASTGGDGLSGGLVWNVDTTCQGANPYCVIMPSPHPPFDMANGPNCAASPAPVSECEGDAGPVCWQNVPATCEDGFLVLSDLSRGQPGGGIPCADPNPFCVPPVGCTASPTVVSQCAVPGNACWENAPAFCSQGFVVVAGQACGDGAVCASQCTDGGTCCEEADEQ